MKTIYNLISLGFSFTLNITFVLMFYTMLFSQSAILIVDANSIGEFWIEFFLVQLALIFTCLFFRSEAKAFFKEARLK